VLIVCYMTDESMLIFLMCRRTSIAIRWLLLKTWRTTTATSSSRWSRSTTSTRSIVSSCSRSTCSNESRSGCPRAGWKTSRRINKISRNKKQGLVRSKDKQEKKKPNLRRRVSFKKSLDRWRKEREKKLKGKKW